MCLRKSPYKLFNIFIKMIVRSTRYYNKSYVGWTVLVQHPISVFAFLHWWCTGFTVMDVITLCWSFGKTWPLITMSFQLQSLVNVFSSFIKKLLCYHLIAQEKGEKTLLMRLYTLLFLITMDCFMLNLKHKACKFLSKSFFSWLI